MPNPKPDGAFRDIEVIDVDGRIAAIGQAASRSGPVHLMPIIESALGAWRAYEIAAASDNVVSLAIGLEDYTADIGAQRTLVFTVDDTPDFPHVLVDFVTQAYRAL